MQILALGICSLSDGVPADVLIVAPTIASAHTPLIFQRTIVAGLTTGGLKGWAVRWRSPDGIRSTVSRTPAAGTFDAPLSVPAAKTDLTGRTHRGSSSSAPLRRLVARRRHLPGMSA
ncbi:hypothetical protein [Streptomyces sp. NRRL F-3273]|uniref:hypothetical protein n=1 Tax=Streptomyces sp. NRRL F-3273 TaxID=1463848 RepID=UPI00131ECD6E